MRRDLDKYILDCQHQFDLMQNEVKKLNEKMQSDPTIVQDKLDYLNGLVINLKTNYDRVLYCKYLLNLPPKFIQKIRKKKLDKEAQKFIKEHADKESVKEENQKCIDELSKLNSEGEPNE